MTDVFNSLLGEVNDAPLSKTLPRILRLAQEWGDDELDSWVRLELRGYYQTNAAMSEETVVPAYRTVPGQWRDEFGRVLAIRQPDLRFLNEIRLREGVVELEALADSRESLYVRLPQFAELIRANLDVDVSLFEFAPSSVQHVIAEIKTELSDHLAARRDLGATFRPTDLASGTVEDVIELRPNVFGIGLNLRALWRRLQGAQGQVPDDIAPEDDARGRQC